MEHRQKEEAGEGTAQFTDVRNWRRQITRYPLTAVGERAWSLSCGCQMKSFALPVKEEKKIKEEEERKFQAVLSLLAASYNDNNALALQILAASGAYEGG